MIQLDGTFLGGRAAVSGKRFDTSKIIAYIAHVLFMHK